MENIHLMNNSSYSPCIMTNFGETNLFTKRGMLNFSVVIMSCLMFITDYETVFDCHFYFKVFHFNKSEFHQAMNLVFGTLTLSPRINLVLFKVNLSDHEMKQCVVTTNAFFQSQRGNSHKQHEK